jgi:hypothetical protein
MNHSSSVQILEDATAVGTYGPKHTPLRTPKRSFQVRGYMDAGVGTVTVQIQASNIPVPDETTDDDWFSLADVTIALSTTPANDAFTTDAPYRHVRAKVTAITAVDAHADCYMGG